MATSYNRLVLILLALLMQVFPLELAAEQPWAIWRSEQKRIQFRDPSQLREVAPLVTARPQTVSDLPEELPANRLSLDEAIRIALQNSEVVRTLGGLTASTSGRTIYDVAITNTAIDQQRGVFDPQFRANNAWSQDETPFARQDPLNHGSIRRSRAPSELLAAAEKHWVECDSLSAEEGPDSWPVKLGV